MFPGRDTNPGERGQVQPVRALQEALLAQRGYLTGWVPVCLGLGIGGWFALKVEPTMAAYVGLGVFAALCLLASRRAGEAFGPLFAALALIAIGGGLAGLRAHLVSAPVLDFRYYGAIEGRVVKIDRSSSDALRLTLDRVRLERIDPDRTPKRVRISLHGGHGPTPPAPGQVVIVTGHLSGPGGPVEPGGFDFARHAYFDRLGAVGYARTPLLLLRPAEPGAALWLHRFRSDLSEALRTRVGGKAGGVAAAIVTGDRSGVGQEVTVALRHSNLAHLLAISGLHMGLLTGFVFAALRAAGALVPHVALHWPVKKMAAGIALVTGAAYLAISGGSVATERAFIMVAVMLVSVMLERRAITLRAVAIAATIVLVRRPEELTGPGFQMSFAATTALVVAYSALREIELPRGNALVRSVGNVLFSSLVAGLATAPFAAAHFNMVSHYGLVANLLAVPVMGAVVMPVAVLAACLWPLGLAGIGLWIMEQGLRWILFVAETVAAQPGAVGHVPSPGPIVLPVLTLGLLGFVLWRGRLRLAGLAAVPAALMLWVGAERPDLLITPSGSLIGVLGPEGRALSRDRAEGFAAGAWMENDGNPVPQPVAFARPGLTIEGRVVRAEIAGLILLQVRGKTARAALTGCGGADFVIFDTILDEPARPCLTLDPAVMTATGAVAGWATPQGLRLVTATEITGTRAWTPRPRRDAPDPAEAAPDLLIAQAGR